MKRMLKVVLGIVAALVAYLALWPVPIDPVAWQSPKAPSLVGEYQENDALEAIRLFPTPNSNGPEDVAEGPDGRVYVGTQQGTVLRYEADGTAPTVLADTGGRPLGLDFDNDGNLIVADAIKGLLSIDPAGSVTVLCTEAAGKPLGFTDDVDVDSNNVSWFSDASVEHGVHEVMDDVLENRPYGRLVKYDPSTKACTEVVAGFYFANGIAVAPDDSYVLINETTRYRVKRYWITGPKAGTTELFIDNLPGFPDGISTGDNGVFWLAIYAPRNDVLDDASGDPGIRKLIRRLPEWARPKPLRHPFVLALNAEAEIVHNLQDVGGDMYGATTSAQQHGNRLYIGSLSEPAWGWVPVPDGGAKAEAN